MKGTVPCGVEYFSKKGFEACIIVIKQSNISVSLSLVIYLSLEENKLIANVQKK
ncbi:hypothetical protein I080019B2_11660 [Bacteroides stercoris]